MDSPFDRQSEGHRRNRRAMSEENQQTVENS
jgi:hypothetical protein